MIINLKLHDAHRVLRERKSTNTEMWRKQKTIMDAAGVTTEYERLWRREITKYENRCTENQRKKLHHLREKYKKKEGTVPDEIEGVLLKDQEIEEEYTSTPRLYGGIILTNDEQSLLELPPKYAIHEKVNKEHCQAEIEKSLAKLRWEHGKDNDPQGNELPEDEKSWHDPESKTMDFRLFRSTDLTFNSRINVPPPLDNETETALQSLKQKLCQTLEQYNNSVKNNKGTTNLTQ